MSTVEEKDIEAKLRVTLEAEYAEKLAKRMQDVETENNRIIAQAIEQWQADQKKVKLSPEELDKLLSQEYATFTVKVGTGDGMKTFTLVELPQAIEKKFYKMFKDKVKPHLTQMASLLKEVEEGRLEGKIEVLLDLFEPAFDIMCGAVAMVLNPRGDNKEITEEWVANNLSSARMWNILMAQEQLNKLRSFFSHVSLSSLEGRGM